MSQEVEWASAVFVDLPNMRTFLDENVLHSRKVGEEFPSSLMTREELIERFVSRTLWVGRQVAPKVAVVAYRAGLSNKELLDQVRVQHRAFLAAARKADPDWSNLARAEAKTKSSLRVVDTGSSFRGHAVDNALVDEIARVAETLPNVRDFVIFSGDGVFAATAQRLRTWGKKVHVVGFTGHISNRLVSEADSVNRMEVLMQHRVFRFSQA